MIRIKFNNSAKFLTCEFSRMSEHVVTLSNCKEQNVSGFCTYRMSGEQLGDFSEYITVYRVLDDAVQYSNDGSIYIECTAEEMDVDWHEPDPIINTEELLLEMAADHEERLCMIELFGGNE